MEWCSARQKLDAANLTKCANINEKRLCIVGAVGGGIFSEAGRQQINDSFLLTSPVQSEPIQIDNRISKN